jgi:MinD superfamily P-loop ATPase
LELVVVSGKGGTGKTTIATALAEIAKDVIRIDCDVDAPNLYMFYKGKDIEKKGFIGGKKASINESMCKKCGKCETVCKFQAITDFKVDLFECEGCGACTLVCSHNAIELKDQNVANTFITELDKGIISRAEMKIGGDGSGKLVNYLRKNGKKFNCDDKLTIVDGSPGIGCPVISSVAGSDAVLVVTEPTKSGLEDLMRVVNLCEHFEIFIMVCINKYDINEDMSKQIESFVSEKGLELVGKIPYDDTVMKSINELKPITFYKESMAEKAIENMWNTMKSFF